MVKWFKRRGFTDRLYLVNFIATQIVVAISIILTGLSGKLCITDMSALVAIVTGAYAELGVHTAFIVWKAKAENMAKWNNENITM